jgi:hypothetical protein
MMTAVHAPYSRMLTAAPGGTRVPARTPAARRSATPQPRTGPVPAMDKFEVEIGKRYRRAVVRELGGPSDRIGPPSPQHTRGGIAQDYFLQDQRHREERAVAVGIRLGLR